MWLPPVVNRRGDPVQILPPYLAASLAPAVTEEPDDTFGEVSVFPETFSPKMVEGLPPWPLQFQCNRFDVMSLDGMQSHELQIHFRNESVSSQLLVEMGGLDEHLDRGKCQVDTEFARRVVRRKIRLIFDQDNWCQILNPRTLFPTMPSHSPERWDSAT